MSDVDEIKSRINIVDFIGKRVTLKKTGRNFKGLCPFHNEKTPSFIVSPERESWHCFGCFPPGELVKTPFGLHPIETLDSRHYVVTGQGNLQKITRVMDRTYHGELVNVRLKKLDFPVRLTSDHRVLTIHGASTQKVYKNFTKRLRAYKQRGMQEASYHKKLSKYFPIREVEAGKLQKGDLLLYPIRRDIHDIKELDLSLYKTRSTRKGPVPRSIPLRVYFDDDLLTLLGYYIAEGSSHRAYIRFSLSNDEEDFAQEIVKLSKLVFGLTASIHKRSGGKSGLEVTVCHSVLADIFETLCGKGADQKHIPWVCQELPTHKQKVLLNAIFRGDGCAFRANKSLHIHKNIVTVSKVLAEQLVDVLLRVNIFPTLAVEKPKIDKKLVHHKKAYRIFWSETAKQKYCAIYPGQSGVDWWILPIASTAREYYEGPVFNLTIGTDHSYVASSFAVANCGKGGDVFSFVQEYDHVDFVEALEELAEITGVKLTRRVGETPEAKLKQKIFEVNHLASEYYQYVLTKHKLGEKALSYLKHRGISDKSIKTFGLGYSPNSWDTLSAYLKKKGYDADLLEKAGLTIKRSGSSGYYDRFRGRVMFTLKDHRGNVVGFSGRVLDPTVKEAKYINTSETPVYTKGNVLYGLDVTKSAIQKENEAIVMEGELDIISSFQEGISNVVAIKGSALTEGHVNLIRRYTEKLAFALDSDLAGDAASRRGIEIADRAGLDMRVVMLPSGKDPDDAVRENPAAVKKAIKEAIPIYDYFISSAVKRFDTISAFGKKKVSEEFLPILAKIENPIVQGHYIKKLAKILDTSEETIVESMRRQAKGVGMGAQKAEKQEESTTRAQKLETYVLALVLQGKTAELFEELSDRIKLTDIANPAVHKILDHLKLFLAANTVFLIKDFADSLPTELVPTMDEAFLWDIGELLDDEELFAREWMSALRGLERAGVKWKIQEITDRMQHMDTGDKDDEALRALTDRLKALEKEG
ncbi:MAG: DNA primase [Candidatus Gottesmanbacteria bacterium]|nr:DNA primase [Candidatus Gottesmanbacteria bacterium]